MSFSGNIKEELAGHQAKARHCNLAELSALVEMAGAFRETESGVCRLAIHTENLRVARKGFTLLQKTFNIRTDIVVRRNTVKGKQQLSYLRQRRRAFGCQGRQSCRPCAVSAHTSGGHFLLSGSMSDPSKSYHFEIGL